MKITMTPTEQVASYILQEVERKRKAILYNLSYIGEMCVNKARLAVDDMSVALGKKAYKNQTGNLRNSIGYAIVENGSIIRISGFGGGEGQSNGESYAKELASQVNGNNISLIIVAGMDYAMYVSGKGYDVLDSAELVLEEESKDLLKRLGL